METSLSKTHNFYEVDNWASLLVQMCPQYNIDTFHWKIFDQKPYIKQNKINYLLCKQLTMTNIISH